MSKCRSSLPVNSCVTAIVQCLELTRCVHILATAETTGKLKEFLAWFGKSLRKANLTKLSNLGMPAKSGKEKNARGSSKKKKSGRSFIATTQRIKLSNPSLTSNLPSTVEAGY